jgi:hypothetical protein
MDSSLYLPSAPGKQNPRSTRDQWKCGGWGKGRVELIRVLRLLREERLKHTRTRHLVGPWIKDIDLRSGIRNVGVCLSDNNVCD